jgi:hypothetical protein
MADAQASMGMRQNAPSQPAPVQEETSTTPSPSPPPITSDFDIRNYKCIPLDLLKNIGTDGTGNDVIQLTSQEPTLFDFKKQQDTELSVTGPAAGGISGDTLENFIVGITITFVVLILLVIIYWGFLNIRAKGIQAFALPEQLRTMPVVLLFSLIFGVAGFLIGNLVKT